MYLCKYKAEKKPHNVTVLICALFLSFLSHQLSGYFFVILQQKDREHKWKQRGYFTKDVQRQQDKSRSKITKVRDFAFGQSDRLNWIS